MATKRELQFSQMLVSVIYEAAEQAEIARPIGEGSDGFEFTAEELLEDPKLMLAEGEGPADIATDEQSSEFAVKLPTGEIFFVSVVAAKDADHARSLALLKMIQSDADES